MFEQEPVEIDEAVRIMATVAHAVDHLHQQDIVHRDLKPSNILVTEDGGLIPGEGEAGQGLGDVRQDPGSRSQPLWRRRRPREAVQQPGRGRGLCGRTAATPPGIRAASLRSRKALSAGETTGALWRRGTEAARQKQEDLDTRSREEFPRTKNPRDTGPLFHQDPGFKLLEQSDMEIGRSVGSGQWAVGSRFRRIVA